MMPAHVRLLAGSTGSTASFLDCLAARALQDLLRRHTPPQALQMSRRGSRGATRVLCILGSVLLPMCVVRCAVHGICVLSVDTRAIVLVEKSDRDKNSDRDDLVSSTM